MHDLATEALLVQRLEPLVARILALRASASPRRSLLVALTGIDGCGKGFVAERLRKELAGAGLCAGVVGVDGWLNLPAVRFDARDPAGHFYRHALRLEELFAELVLPLRERRSLRVEADFAEETATSYRRHVYEYRDLDVILLEGIYLLKRALQDGRYDLAVWIECSFETALERAIARAQEGLPPDETVRAYRTLYFPAQELHLRLDRPLEAAHWILPNDGGPGRQRGSTQTLR
jgi:uridine kinase